MNISRLIFIVEGFGTENYYKCLEYRKGTKFRNDKFSRFLKICAKKYSRCFIFVF